jgi:hypothetical protein
MVPKTLGQAELAVAEAGKRGQWHIVAEPADAAL